MLRVTIDLDSYGLGISINTLATVEIANISPGNKRLGDYRVRLYGEDGSLIREGSIEGWPRLDKHVVDLVHECLSEVRK